MIHLRLSDRPGAHWLLRLLAPRPRGTRRTRHWALLRELGRHAGDHGARP